MIPRKQPSTWITIRQLPSQYPILRCTLVINQLVEKYIKSGLAAYCSQCSVIQRISTTRVRLFKTINMNKFTVVFFVAVIALAQALTDEQKAKVQAISKECREKTGVKEELILKARKGEFVDDPKLKEHLFCFSKKIGFQNEAGALQPEVIKSKIGGDIPAADLQKAHEKCASIKSSTPAQTAFDLLKCYTQASGAKISFS